MKKPICAIVKLIMTYPENYPGNAAVAKQLARLTIMQTACNLTPSITNTSSASLGEYGPLEYLLSEQVGPADVWQTHPAYWALMARKLDNSIVSPDTDADDVTDRLEQMVATVDIDDVPLPASRTAALEKYIAKKARHQAVTTVGLLVINAVPIAVEAAYAYRRCQLTVPLDRMVDDNRPAIDSAYRSYMSRVMVESLGQAYEQLEGLAANRAVLVHDAEISPAQQWWQQLNSDLLAFQIAHI